MRPFPLFRPLAELHESHIQDPVAASRRRDSTGYVYRRPLSAAELLPAIGVGVAAGLAAFYVARLFLERTPLLPEERRLGKHHASGPRDGMTTRCGGAARRGVASR